MGIAFSQIDDAVMETQQRFIKQGSFLDLQHDLTDHVAVREIWKGRKTKFSGGRDWRFEAQIDHNHTARAVGLYEQDSSNVTDNMANGKVEPRHVNAYYVYDQREPDFQAGGRGIVDLVKARYAAMIGSFYETLEDFLWGKPDDDSDLKTPYGIAYWITRSATEGFYGGNPAGFTSGRAGISTGTVPRWANWTAQYNAVSKTDLVRKMRRAHRKSQFKSPLSHAQPKVGGMGNGIYTSDPVIGLMEEILEDQNMNLGNELASKDGRTMFKGSPVTYVPKLDDDSGDPVYMLDWSWLAIGCMEGWENNLSKPMPVPGHHTVRRVDLDCSLNMICTNLRRQAVLSKAA